MQVTLLTTFSSQSSTWLRVSSAIVTAFLRRRKGRIKGDVELVNARRRGTSRSSAAFSLTLLVVLDKDANNKDCNQCHTIVGQGSPGSMQYSNIRENLEFQHPVDIGTAWKEANCSECHRYLY